MHETDTTTRWRTISHRIRDNPNRNEPLHTDEYD